MKYILPFNFLTPFATSKPEGKTFRNLSLLVMVLMLGVNGVMGQVSYTSGTYTQNFNGLAATNNASVTWTNNSTLEGWYLFNKAPAAITSYGAETGSTGQNTFNSYGDTSGVAERALGGQASGGAYWGSPSSGNIAGWIAVQITNGSGGTLNSVTIGFDGEQWRKMDNASAHTMVLEYGFGSTFSDVLSWTAPGGNFNWASPVTGSTGTAVVNGNVAGLVSARGGTITGLTWTTSQTLWIRWVERNDVGNDHALAIDNFTFTAAASSNSTITVSSASLTNFSQTSSTPSAEQTYTVSGNNLTNNVTLTPPTGFEISTTTGSGFTNSIVLTQSGGVLSGQPVTIYVRQNSSTLGAVSGNIVHTSTDATNVNIALSGSRTGTYYSKSTGNLDDLASWGLNTDGTGTSPSNFTSDGAIYEIRNRATATIGANWVVSGSASKVVVGDGTNATDFTIPSGFTLTGTIDVSNEAEFTIENTTPPTFGTFATNSTLEYNNVAVTLSTSITYRNLKLTGTGAKTFPGSTTTIAGNLILNGSSLNGGSGPFSTILLAGNLTYVGTVTPPTDANSITLSTNGTASGTQTFTGAGNTLRWFRITTTTANTILLSTTGGSSNVLLGNATSGGLTLADGSIFNMNGNDFQLFSGGASFILNTTGSISTTSNTDFNLEKTTTASLGTLRFTTGFNTIGNLTLNHTGATNNTLTIGNALNITGIVTVTDGTLASGGNITLKSNANGTAQVAAIGSGGTITGNVTVERFIPSGKRAFRLLSPAVTTTTFISGNWQGQTHITGGASGGFDVTETNNPSMFTYNNQVASGTGWIPIANTNATNLTAGVGYRMLVRGDRNVNLNVVSQDNMNAAITLSATGTLKTGTVTLDESSTPAINNTANTTTADYSLVGNPYQSAVDWNAVTKSGIDASYYAWDPNMGTSIQRGRYVVFNGTTNDNVSSQVGQFIQPGQAFFVKNTVSGTAGTLTFQEAHKATTNANVFRTNNQTESANFATLSMQLYDPNELVIGGYPIDATKAVFGSDYTNELGLGDATKLEAAGENITWFRNNTKLAIDAAAPVTTSDELALKTLRLGANKNYTFKIQTTNFDADLTPYLVDTFLNTQTEISTSQAFIASFATTSNQVSYGEDRFKIVFQTSALSTDDFANNIKLYPNPAKAGGSFYIDGITEATVLVYNVVGQNIPVTVMSQGNATQVTPTTALSNGVYLVSITTQGITKKVKWIVE